MATQQGTQTTTATSGSLSLNWKDGIKSLIMAIGTPVLYIVQELIPGWDVHPIVKAAIAATVTYLIKNFFSPTQLVITNPTPQAIAAVKQGTAQAEVVSTGSGITPPDLNKPSTN